jgi:CheY-like chemotaxis protein
MACQHDLPPPIGDLRYVSRILLVDDEEAVRELLTLVLQLDGHDVLTASDGNRALDALAHEEFDLVLTDLVMPGRDGIDTIAEIRQRFPQLRIIAMSGGGRGSAGDHLAIARQLGAKRTLEKPFSNQQLLETTREVLAIAPG